jgi:hypothetical protein
VARRERILAYGGAVALVLVGGLCGWLIPGLTGDVVRLSLITLGFGAVLLLVFYEIGLSEDKARAREEEERRQREEPPQPGHDEPERRPWSARRQRRPG